MPRFEIYTPKRSGRHEFIGEVEATDAAAARAIGAKAYNRTHSRKPIDPREVRAWEKRA